MKRITLLAIVVFSTIFMAACGASAPTATQVPVSQPVVTEPAIQPAATEPPTEAAAASTEVIITLADNSIESSLTTFKVGVPYTFVITNKGNHDHNFNIAQPVSVAGSLDAALQNALLAVPKNQLGGGAQVTVEYTFPDTAASTQLEFSCLIKRHYDDGMYLAITVTN
jgi:uncharacterized cupredoxin-like copper-binding protein